MFLFSLKIQSLWSESIDCRNSSFQTWWNIGPAWCQNINHLTIHLIHVAFIQFAIIAISVGIVIFSGGRIITILDIARIQVPTESIQFGSVVHVTNVFTSIGIIGT